MYSFYLKEVEDIYFLKVLTVYGDTPCWGDTQDPNSLWLGPQWLRGVMTQVFPTNLIKTPIYIYINIYFIAIPRDKIKKGIRRVTRQVT
jgi:hypothetical protein